MTVGDIITLALKASGVVGVGQTASAEDANDAFTLLNNMLAVWQRKRWLIWHLVDVAFQSTGAASYTIGVGGSFNVFRPDRIEAAYARQMYGTGTSGYLDFPLTLIEAHEDYASISLKSLTTFPAAVFYDSAFPLGSLYFYPIPSVQYELHVIVKETLAQFAGLTSALNLPPEYADALMWNLAQRLRPMYQMPPEPTISAAATVALATIRGANSQVPRLSMPPGLSGRGGSTYVHGVGGPVESFFTTDESVLG